MLLGFIFALIVPLCIYLSIFFKHRKANLAGEIFDLLNLENTFSKYYLKSYDSGFDPPLFLSEAAKRKPLFKLTVTDYLWTQYSKTKLSKSRKLLRLGDLDSVYNLLPDISRLADMIASDLVNDIRRQLNINAVPNESSDVRKRRRRR